MNEKIKQSRRAFLKGGLALSAVGLAPAVLAKSSEDNAIQWDETFDVVVVGSGLAGTCAAIRAKENGAKNTIIIEKMPVLGGTSAISGLNFSVVNSHLQQAQGIEDSAALFAEDISRAGGYQNHRALTLKMADTTTRVLPWAIERGCRFHDKLKSLGGHSVPRTLYPVNGGGKGILRPLRRFYTQDLQGDIRRRVKFDKLHLNARGEVMGIQVREQYFFDPNLGNDDRENTTGTIKHYRVTKGVVMAVGGYSRDVEFRAMEFPNIRDYIPTTTHRGATAGALKSLVAAGAQTVHLSLMRFAFDIPTEDLQWGALVDPKTGQRFISEKNNRQVVAEAICNIMDRNEGRFPLNIYDQDGIDNFHDKQRLHLALEEGMMVKYDSIEALANGEGIDLTGLAATLKRYNEDALSGKDSQFGKDMAALKQVSVKRAPFYAIKARPKFNYTQGGVLINENAQVINRDTAQPIKGLYACGEATGGLFGRIRLTACSCPDAFAFGVIAGEQVAKA
ncbi:flavocytochrome c [Shewanella amazonensis]|uniref:Flavocytochrome c flavin subunit n=1 Tax=Shewanella amazonensis (strain ATCC BAA-1098 / SB2B) TaxID=326297 RepID=A1S899_SHEAM|nr:flavocytochrome c [Shewanella amazonensis]ABM00606.1 flavocytochrome c flavin subunit [Shewanella amazonensis SB2B]